MTETVTYEITGQIGEIEFRKYPPMVLATVKSPGNDSGFNLLFSYITGNNHAKGQIPMTAPVITSAQIPMTSPVVSDEQSMSFVMPRGKRKRGDAGSSGSPGEDHLTASTGDSCHTVQGLCRTRRRS